MFTKEYADVFTGDDALARAQGAHRRPLHVVRQSTYVRNPPYFEGMTMTPPGIRPGAGRARARDARRFDHHRPHLARRLDREEQPGRRVAHGARRQPQSEFNSYGARRGNDEVMIRGTFANIRLRTSSRPAPKAASRPPRPAAPPMPIYDAAEEYKKAGTPLIVIAGKEYGTG